ncbi:PDR/VanB family oxidoreductase [Bradyrhizobium sp. 14AA]
MTIVASAENPNKIMKAGWIEAEVRAKWLEAANIFSYELMDVRGRRLPAFEAGAHIDVEIEAGLVRQYSLCNHPLEEHRYLIGVLLDQNSRGGSLAMHRKIQRGDRIRISEPRNNFALEPSAKRHLLFAGGIGITPIICMAERLEERRSDFEMHYCARTAEHAAFASRIRRSSFSERVQFHYDNGPDAQKLDLEAVLQSPTPETHIYVCGPAGFITWVLDTAKATGWVDAQLHREYFVPAARSTEAGEFEVQVASSGKVLVVRADQPITAALAESGIEVPTSCEQGVCGTCLTRVLEGEPDHRDFFLTDEERLKNDRMLLCCSRANSARLILDL